MRDVGTFGAGLVQFALTLARIRQAVAAGDGVTLTNEEAQRLIEHIRLLASEAKARS